jgi:hypothetical protein
MNDRETHMRYQIHNESGMYTLYSVVKTRFGGDARNYVAESSDIEYLEFIAAKIGVMPKEIEYVG